ncbi:MAG: acetyltransferase [Candidatus Electrothrix sp. AR5]|nr:acetyltransferase [Candidatus Electrothrix sp. AR5]
MILGGGGHAKVVLDTLRCMSYGVLGYLSLLETESDGFDIKYLGNDEAIVNYKPSTVLLVNGVGSSGIPDKRTDVFTRFKKLGYHFLTVIHPSAVVASDVELGEGCQVMAGSVLQPGVYCGENVIINTRAGVDHDCRIGSHAHIAVGVTLSGNVRVGCLAHIGTASSVIQDVSVGKRSVVAAGAAVIRNVLAGETVAGIPARRILK